MPVGATLPQGVYDSTASVIVVVCLRSLLHGVGEAVFQRERVSC